MGQDYIPGADAEFHTWIGQFTGAIDANATGFGLTALQVTSVKDAAAFWTAKFKAFQDAETAYHAARESKDKARAAAEKPVRSTVHTINGHPGVDNEMRAQAALPAHDEVRSAIGAPTTRPIPRIEARGHLMLVLHFVDETTPLRTAKPHGVHGCDIQTHIGDPAPATDKDWTHLALDTRTPYSDEHDPADAGKTVYYRCRWQSTKGENGPWSDVVSAKIPL